MVAESGGARQRSESDRELVRLLYVALCCARERGDLLAAAVQALAAELVRGGVPMLVMVQGHGFELNGSRLVLDSSTFVAAETIRALFGEQAIAGVSLAADLPLTDLEATIRLLAAPDVADRRAELQRLGVTKADILPDERRASGLLAQLDGRRRGVPSDLRSVYVAKILLDQAGDAGLGNPRLAKSVLRSVADAILSEPSLIALLAELETSELRLVRHGAMVAVHAIILGRSIGLPLGLVVELGVAALFHDIGMAGGAAEDHSEVGFERLMSAGPSRLALQSMLVALRHHEPVDDDSLAEFSSSSGLLAVIVHTADAYAYGCAEGGPAAGAAALQRAVAAGAVPAMLARELENGLSRVRSVAIATA